eukprot:Gb_30050 [translate_table: standard]
MARWALGVAAAGGGGGGGGSSIFLVMGVCITAIIVSLSIALCAIRPRKENGRSTDFHGSREDSSGGEKGENFAAKSPRALLDNSSANSKKFLLTKKWSSKLEEKRAKKNKEGDSIWQRNILMGERCRPPNFSGAILYDDKGNRLPHFPPKSPRGDVFNPQSSLQPGNNSIIK